METKEKNKAYFSDDLPCVLCLKRKPTYELQLVGVDVYCTVCHRMTPRLAGKTIVVTITPQDYEQYGFDNVTDALNSEYKDQVLDNAQARYNRFNR